MVGHFVPLVTQRDHWDQRDSVSRGLSVPHSMAGRLGVGSGTSQEPLLNSLLSTFSETEKFWPWKRLGPIQTGGLSKTMACEWHSSFCQKQGKDSEFPYILSFTDLSQNPDLRDSCRKCLSVASLSPVPFCLSPSDFQMTPTQSFISTWSLGKDSEVPFGPGSPRDQIHPFKSF